MWGVNQWWPIRQSDLWHYMLDTSSPANFRFACGRRSARVIRRKSFDPSEVRKCEQCLAALKEAPATP